MMAQYDTDNIFAKIIAGDIPCNKVFENEHVLAFHDVNPAAPVHVLVIPKRPYISFHDFSTQASPEEVMAYFSAVQHVTTLMKVDESGYRLIANHGMDASQTVPHFHMHILGGRPLGGLLTDDKLSR